MYGYSASCHGIHFTTRLGENTQVPARIYGGPGTNSPINRTPECQCNQIQELHIFILFKMLSFIIAPGHDFLLITKIMITNFRKNSILDFRYMYGTQEKSCYPCCFFNFCTSLVMQVPG